MSMFKRLLTGACAVGISIAASGFVLAQDDRCTPEYPPPPGVPTNCVIVDGQKVWVDINGNPVPGQSEGGATFIAQESQQSPCGTSQQPESFDVSVRTEQYGVINATLDRERDSPLSTIISNQEDAPFPATAKIQVYLRATVEATGEELQSRGLVTLVSENVETFPFEGAEFTLQDKAEFVRAGELDGEAVLTLTETRVVLFSER